MIAGVLLAAGASRRMGSPKPLARLEGESFLSRGIRHLWRACGMVVVVLGSNARPVRAQVEVELQRLLADGTLHQDLKRADRHGTKDLEVHFVVHPGWRRGMYSSARIGLAEALRLKPEAILLMPVDHPAVKPETVHDLATVMRLAIQACRSGTERNRFSYGLVPRYRRRRGHPVALSRALAQAVAKDGDAENLSDAVRRNARLLGFLDVGDPGVVLNQNTRRTRLAR
jgi:CTP:molybdopterin cytidylyltransferase MocA